MVVGVVVVVVVVGVVGATYLPITIVTTIPFLAWVEAAGFWLRTTPFWVLSVTVCGCWVAGNPAAPSAALAAPVVLPTTFGTATVAGALATTRVTVEPLGTDFPPTGSWPRTVLAVAVLDTWLVVVTLNPRLWSVALA